MPRNGSGTYTLPTGNPVVAGTTIEASWANNTLADVATELTGSLSRSGAGGMTGPLRLDAGTSGVPGLAWGAETTTGFYRAGTNDMRLAVATADVQQWTASGTAVTGTLSVSGATTLTGAATLTANPTLSGGTANGVLYLNGSKVATSGSGLQYNGSTLTLFSNVAGLSIQTGVNTNQATVTLADVDGRTAVFRSPNATSPNCAQIGTTTNHDTAFLWGNAEQMRLTSIGLGIGTASPGNRLHVQGSGDVARFTNGSRDAYLALDSAGFTLFTGAGQTGSGFYARGSDQTLQLWTNSSAKVWLDSSGNLGLEVTPSAWGFRALQVNTTSLWSAGGSTGSFGQNMYHDGTNRRYITTANATEYQQSGGTHAWFTAPSGTAGNAITFTQAMTLDASGNLGVGTASPGSKLEVYGGAAGTSTNAQVGNASTAFLFGVDTSNNCQIRTAQNVPIIIYTNATTRGQVSADGNFVWGTAALATTATAGFPWIPSCAGVPTGAPTAPYTNAAAMVVDTTNNRLYIRVGSTWRYASLI